MTPLRTTLAAATVAASLLLCAPAGAAGLRVIGGTPVGNTAFGYTVALVQAGQDEYEGQFCGGTLVAPDRVVTAAHCLQETQPEDVEVVTGRATLARSGPGQRLAVIDILRHPGWNPRTGAHDIAVLQLADPSTAPLLTPAGPADAPVARPGAVVAVAGWGMIGQAPNRWSRNLRATMIRVVPDRRCKKAYGAYRSRTQLCATGRGHDSCYGDSGGPLVAIDAAAQPRLVGVVSYGGPACADPSQPGVYTRVSGEANWLAWALRQ